MIRPVTYQGVFNFDAHLYALEIKSRFIDQNNANGYYTGYGAELAATVVGNQIKIGTGAFVIQGRMNEITSAEIVTPQMFNNFVGYVVARIETYHPSDAGNCTLKAVVNTAFSEIALQTDDVYAGLADSENKVYELPIYSFEIKNGAITNLTKLIKPVDDYARIKAEFDKLAASTAAAIKELTDAANSASVSAAAAQKSATDAANSASNANTAAQSAASDAQSAANAATVASDTANEAKSTAENAVDVVNQQHAAMTAEINALAQQIADKQGTTVTMDGDPLATFEAKGLLDVADEIVIKGGNA